MDVRGARLVSVVLLAVSACSGPPHPAPREAGAAPIHVPEGSFCPPGDAIAAYRGLFYPSTYPSPPPPAAHLARCYETSAQATSAGYRLAPPPRDAVMLGGMYLVPPSPSLAPMCRTTGDLLGFAVPCPTLLPARASVDIEHEGGIFIVNGSFAVPPGYVGVPEGPERPDESHLVILAAASSAHLLRDFCRPAASSKTALGGRPAILVECPPGSALMSHHTALSWVVGGIRYAVSLHGHSALNARLDTVIADHSRLIG